MSGSHLRGSWEISSVPTGNDAAGGAEDMSSQYDMLTTAFSDFSLKAKRNACYKQCRIA